MGRTMAVQIKYPDGSSEWVRGDYYPDKWGFSVFDRHANPRHGQHRDFGTDFSVISLTPDDNVTDWNRRWSDPGGATGNDARAS